MVVGADMDPDGASAHTDRVFHALADGTRRALLSEAAERPQSVSALARRHPMSVTAIQKHVAVLEAADLVRRERRGREQIVIPEAGGLLAARRALNRLEVLWSDRLEQFGNILEEPR